eukprot:UN17984
MKVLTRLLQDVNKIIFLQIINAKDRHCLCIFS